MMVELILWCSRIGLIANIVLFIINIMLRTKKYIIDLFFLFRKSMIAILGYFILKVVIDNNIRNLLDGIIIYNGYILLILIIIFVIECFVLNSNSKKNFSIVNINWMINILFIELSIFLITNQDWIYIFNVIIWIVNIYNLEIYLKNIKNKNLVVNLKSDVPCSKCDELFKSRRFQLEYILNYINKIDYDEYFSMVLNGEWGSGKTSLLNVLKQKLEQKGHFIIYIKPMIVDSRESLMKYFIDKLQFLFSENGIYTGKQSYIRIYFESILRLMNLNKRTKVEEIFNINIQNKKDYRRVKKDLQTDINSLLEKDKAKIILLVDDFDRVNKDTQNEILSFINEVVDFKGVNIIFLMDYDKIIDDKITYEFMEKFINKRIDLSKVDYNEIIEFYLKLNQVQNNENSLVIEVIKKMEINYKDYIEKLKEKLNQYKILKEKEINKAIVNNEDKLSKLRLQIKNYDQLLNDLYKNFQNIRKLKNIIKEIIDYYKYIENSEDYNKLKEYYISNECIELIIRVFFCKNVFFEEYNVMVQTVSFYKYIENIRSVYFKEIEDIDIYGNKIKESVHIDMSMKIVIYYLFEDISSIFGIEEKQVKINKKIKIIDSIIMNEKTPNVLLFKTQKQKYFEFIDTIKYKKDNNEWCEKFIDNIKGEERVEDGKVNKEKESINYKQLIVDLYDYILYDLYDDNEKTKDRINLVNQLFILLYKDKRIEIEDSINIINELFGKNDFINLNYILLCNFWREFKKSKTNFKRFADKRILKLNLEILSHHIMDNIKSTLRLIVEIMFDEEKIRRELLEKINNLNNLNGLNHLIYNDILILDKKKFKKEQDEIIKFDCFREQLKFKLYEINFGNINIDINYIVCGLTRYRILNSIIFRGVSKLEDSKIEFENYEAKNELKLLKDYNKFIDIVEEFNLEMKHKNYNYNYSDIRILELIITKMETIFKDKNCNGDIIKILEYLYEKITQRTYKMDYTKIQIQFIGAKLFRLINKYHKE